MPFQFLSEGPYFVVSFSKVPWLCLLKIKAEPICGSSYPFIFSLFHDMSYYHCGHCGRCNHRAFHFVFCWAKVLIRGGEAGGGALATLYGKLIYRYNFTFYSKRKIFFPFSNYGLKFIRLHFTSNQMKVYIFMLYSETLLHFTSKQFCQITLTLKNIHYVFRQIMDAIFDFREMKWGIYDLTKKALHPLYILQLITAIYHASTGAYDVDLTHVWNHVMRNA